MNIYIANNCKDEPLSVLLAETRQKADIVWAAMKEYPHHVEEITQKDMNNQNLGIHGVVFLLCSGEVTFQDINGRTQTIRKFRRGL